MAQFEQWAGFAGRNWKSSVDVRDFIQNNYTPYDGDESFLEGPTEGTEKLWDKLQELQKEERAKGGVLDMETEIVSGLTAYGPGYIDEELKDLETVVGLQTDKPLKRAFMPYGGIKMAEQACTTYGYQPSEKLHEIFTKYHKTHNQGVFDIYTPEMKKARHNKIITGLPDTYGRGRIVGDYRRVALYGIDFLIAEKQKDLNQMGDREMIDEVIRLREEVAMQIKALKGLKEMAASYGFDKNVKLSATYLHSDLDSKDVNMLAGVNDVDTDGYVISLGYKGAKANQVGSWGANANYYNQGVGTFVAHTMNTGDWGYLYREGFKGYSVGANYTLAKNIVYSLNYYDLEGKETSTDTQVLWSRLQVTF